jgi:hypothetical protein
VGTALPAATAVALALGAAAAVVVAVTITVIILTTTTGPQVVGATLRLSDASHLYFDSYFSRVALFFLLSLCVALPTQLTMFLWRTTRTVAWAALCL